MLKWPFNNNLVSMYDAMHIYSLITVDSILYSFNVDHIIIESRLIHCQNWLKIQRYFNVDHSEHFQCIFQCLTSMLITTFSLTISQRWFNQVLLSVQGQIFTISITIVHLQSQLYSWRPSFQTFCSIYIISNCSSSCKFAFFSTSYF